jgi:CRISPR system Cascade subunit CasD
VVAETRNHNSQSTIELPMQRMEDFHTVGAGYDADRDWQFMPRSAQGKTLGNPVVTHRQYLLDARFGLLLAGEPPVLSPVADAVRNPVWGVWFGRKCCIPAAPIYRAGPCDEAAAWRALINDTPRDQLTQVTEVDRFEDGSDTLNDQPLSFGAANSSGPEARRFAPRRIRVIRGL